MNNTSKRNDIKVRVSPQTKAGLQAIADARFLALSDIGREAFREYLARQPQSNANGAAARADARTKKLAAFTTFKLLITLALVSVLAGVALASWADTWPAIVGVGALLLLIYLKAFSSSSKFQIPNSKEDL